MNDTEIEKFVEQHKEGVIAALTLGANGVPPDEAHIRMAMCWVEKVFEQNMMLAAVLRGACVMMIEDECIGIMVPPSLEKIITRQLTKYRDELDFAKIRTELIWGRDKGEE